MTQNQWVPYASLAVPAKPGVLTWFKVYAIGMTVLYLLVAAGGAFLLAMDWTGDPDVDPVEMRINGIALLVVGPPFAIAFLVALFLPLRKWAWIYDLVLICLGLTSCCFWPICIPLLVFWLKQETRQWFGWT